MPFNWFHCDKLLLASGEKEFCWVLPMSREICWVGCVGQSYKRIDLWHHTLVQALSTLMMTTLAHTCGSSK